jgi:hypothetical protein
MNKLIRSIAARLLALGITAGASGCGNDNGPPDLTPFLGTWSVSAAAITVLCSTNTVKAITVTDPIVFVKGSTSDLLDDDPTCPVQYDVSGAIARALPGQTCDNPEVITRMHLLEGSFTPEPGAMARLSASGELDGFIDITLGETVRCTFNEMGVFRRAGN